MSNHFEGDPKLTLDVDGSKITYIGGQPVMDRGIENLILISLFTRPGWVGNTLFDNPDQKIGSDFVDIASQPITSQSIKDIRQAAIDALDNPAFGEVDAVVENPTGQRLNITISIKRFI